MPLLLHCRLADEIIVHKALADNLRQGELETAKISVLILAVVSRNVSSSKIPEQVKRFDAHVCPVNTTLEKAPEILKAVAMNFAVDVGYSMVNDLVGVLTSQSIIGLQLITVKRGASLDVLRFSHPPLS